MIEGMNTSLMGAGAKQPLTVEGLHAPAITAPLKHAALMITSITKFARTTDGASRDIFGKGLLARKTYTMAPRIYAT